MQDFVDNKDFLYKFDISQGYRRIDIDKNHQKCLGFSWKIDGKIRYVIFTVLPFGLCSAPFFFYQAYAQSCKILEKGRDKNLCMY